MKIKYQKVTGWWVYVLITPDGMFYIGCSGMLPEERWKESLYKDKSVWKYIEKYGWDNIRKVILCDCLTEEQAKKLEDLLILEAKKGGWCINDRRSGGIKKDNPIEYQKNQYKKHKEKRLIGMQHYRKEHYEEIKEHCEQYRKDHRDELNNKQKEYYQEHITERKQYAKQWRSTIEGRIYDRVHSFNQKHPDRIIETPLEAKQKYLQRGYIPDYIKSDDLV